MLLAPIVTELRDLTALVASAGISLQSEVAPDLEVDADPDQLSRVLVNLVRNSVQALSQAGTRDGPPRVAIAARREGGTVTIHVADNGPGIPEQARGRLFSAFRSSGRAGGAGLGLAISAELVRLHGGTLSPRADAGRRLLPHRAPGPGGAIRRRGGKRLAGRRHGRSAGRRTRGCKAPAEALSQPSDRRLS